MISAFLGLSVLWLYRGVDGFQMCLVRKSEGEVAGIYLSSHEGIKSE
ncbi:hypothetical protein ES702_06092 [subsurface metagenome]